MFSVAEPSFMRCNVGTVQAFVLSHPLPRMFTRAPSVPCATVLVSVFAFDRMFDRMFLESFSQKACSSLSISFKLGK